MHIKEQVIWIVAKCKYAGAFALIDWLKEEYTAVAPNATATVCLANCHSNTFMMKMHLKGSWKAPVVHSREWKTQNGQITDETHQSMNRRPSLDWYYMTVLHFISAFILSEPLKWMRKGGGSVNDRLKELCGFKLKCYQFFLLLHYVSLCCNYATWQGVAAHTHSKKKKKVVLLRCSTPIGRSSPLKPQYLNQVKKKVRGDRWHFVSCTFGTSRRPLWVLCSLICIAPTRHQGAKQPYEVSYSF